MDSARVVGTERVVRAIKYPVQDVIEAVLVAGGDEAVDLPSSIGVAEDHGFLGFVMLSVHEQVRY